MGKSQPFQTFDYPPYLLGLGGLPPDPVVLMPSPYGLLQSGITSGNGSSTKWSSTSTTTFVPLTTPANRKSHVATVIRGPNIRGILMPIRRLQRRSEPLMVISSLVRAMPTNAPVRAPLVASGCRGIPYSLCGCWSHPRTRQDRHGAVSCGQLQGCSPRGIALCRWCRSLGRCSCLWPRYVCASASIVRSRTRRATLSLGHAALALPSRPLSLCLSVA